MGGSKVSSKEKNARLCRVLEKSKRPFTLKEIERLVSKEDFKISNLKESLKALSDEVSLIGRLIGR